MATATVGQYEKLRALAGDARLLVTGGVRTGTASEVVVFDHAANKLVKFFEAPAHVLALALAGDRVVAGCADGAVRVHLAADGSAVRTLAAHIGACTAVAMAPGGDRVATVGTDGAARLWSLGTGEKLGEWALSGQPLRAVAVDPAGEYLAAAGDDGTVRVVTLATGARREMAGHVGPVYCLAFTPRDGRLVSGGDDGVLRIWYVVGAVEFEARGGDDSGHVGAVYAVAFLPTPESTPAADASDRMVSAGADGKIKVWRLEDRRKPRTLEAGGKPLYALLVVPPANANAARSSAGALFTGGDKRSVMRFALDVAGTPADNATTYGHAFDALAANLTGARPVREKAVKTLSALEEPEALEMLLRALGTDRDAEVRGLAATELGVHRRRGGRAGLRERLNDDAASVRRAALEALRVIDGEGSLVPLRAAMESRHADMRVASLRALVPLRGTSPLVPGLIADRLTDGDAAVRREALDQLTLLHPAGSTDPLRTAYERGPADLKVDVLIRAAFDGQLSAPTMAPVVSRALDDADAGVRRIAFAVKTLERRALAHVLETRDEDFARTTQEIARRGALLARTRAGTVAAPAAKPAAGAAASAAQPPGPNDDEIKAARASLPGVGEPGRAPEEEDLEPVLTALACRTADTALRGARALALLGDTRALGALLQISRETEPVLRREAAGALQQLHDTRARKRLVWMLDDADATVRAAALEAYAKLEGETPLAVAEAALRASHEDIRVRGLNQLVKLGGEAARPEQAETLLGDALEDESAKVRGEAFRTLWSWHTKDPVKALDRALDARFPDLRLRAVTELETQGKDAWALTRLLKSISDRDAGVAQAALDAVLKLRTKGDAEALLLAVASVHAGVRTGAARKAVHAPVDAVRSALTKLLEDADAGVRTAAIETLDKLVPSEAGPLSVGLHSSFLDLRVRAAELLAVRHDEQIVDPMRAFLADKELAKQMPPQVLQPLRARAAGALATLGAPRTVKHLATELLKDEQSDVREQAARGLATASRRGDEGFLLDALGHADAWVRSWAADGLSRLGDVRALPVLTGNLRNTHLPIRLGAIMSFAALGPEGFGGMLQGLEDSSREVQEAVFAIVLARDLRAFRKGAAPDLLTTALSSQRPEIRFAAARALELRTDGEAYLGHVIEVLMPPRPEKAADMKDWPAEHVRARIIVSLADALASDTPEQRYAAAQVLNLRAKPLEYFREASNVGKLRSLDAPWVPDNQLRAPAEADAKPTRGWLRRLFSGDAAEAEGGKERKASGAASVVPAVSADERVRLHRLAFGAYVGLLRQVAAGDDEGQRVRRDAVDRIVDLGLHGSIGPSAAVPAVVRALDDPHYLVRKAAFAGLKKLFPANADAPLTLALASTSADVSKAALDELGARGDDARPRIVAALNAPLSETRRYAFELLERLSPKGSLDPLLAALSSDHADLRLGVVERLASSNDTRISGALRKAMESDHDDLRLRAAELLALRRDEQTVDVLAAFLRADDKRQAERALQALVHLGSAGAVRAMAHRMEDATPEERVALVRAVGRTRNAEGVAVLSARFDDEAPAVHPVAFDAVLEIVGRDREKRDVALALTAFEVAVHAKDPAVRLAAANELDVGDDARANALLVVLFTDRDVATRVAAVNKYARRVADKGAPVAPLSEVLRVGARELVLPAAEGVASHGLSSALRPLLLVARAGEPPERQRALLALGQLGDARALEELETVAGGGTPEAPVEMAEQAAATEALGRIANKLSDVEVRRRVVERVEQASTAAARSDEIRAAAVRGVRWIGGEWGRIRLEGTLGDATAPDPVRIVAAEQLGLLADVAAEGALALALDHWNAAVRTKARAALEKLFPTERTRVEFLAVDSKHADVSQPAAAYLATEGEPALLVPRLATLKNASLRQRLRFGLVRRAVVPVAEVARLLQHDTASVREEAAWFLGATTARPENGAAATLSEADRVTLGKGLLWAEHHAGERWGTTRSADREAEARAWSRALWAATRLSTDGIVPRARAILVAGESAAPAVVRCEAAHTLEHLGGPPDVDLLLKTLTDPDGGVRSAAAVALARHAAGRAATLAMPVRPFDAVGFGPAARGAPATPALLAVPEGRQLILPRLLGTHETAPLVALASTAGDAAARLDAVAALGRAGGDEAVAALRALAFDKNGADKTLAKAAYLALRRAKRKAAREKKYGAQA